MCFLPARAPVRCRALESSALKLKSGRWCEKARGSLVPLPRFLGQVCQRPVKAWGTNSELRGGGGRYARALGEEPRELVLPKHARPSPPASGCETGSKGAKSRRAAPRRSRIGHSKPPEQRELETASAGFLYAGPGGAGGSGTGTV